MAKIILQINYIKIFNIEIRSIEKDRLDVRTCVDEILKSIEILHRGDMYIEEACYLNLFSDIFSDSPYFEDEVKIMFLQK